VKNSEKRGAVVPRKETGDATSADARSLKPGLELRGKYPVGRDPRRMTQEELREMGHEPMPPGHPGSLPRLLRLSGARGSALHRGQVSIVAVQDGKQSLAPAGEPGKEGIGPADDDADQCPAAEERWCRNGRRRSRTRYCTDIREGIGGGPYLEYRPRGSGARGGAIPREWRRQWPRYWAPRSPNVGWRRLNCLCRRNPRGTDRVMPRELPLLFH
jgi:hypothetical protein